MVLQVNGRTSRGTARGGSPPESARNRESRQRAQRTRPAAVTDGRGTSYRGLLSPALVSFSRWVGEPARNYGSSIPISGSSSKQEGAGARQKASLASPRAPAWSVSRVEVPPARRRCWPAWPAPRGNRRWAAAPYAPRRASREDRRSCPPRRCRSAQGSARRRGAGRRGSPRGRPREPGSRRARCRTPYARAGPQRGTRGRPARRRPPRTQCRRSIAQLSTACSRRSCRT